MTDYSRRFGTLLRMCCGTVGMLAVALLNACQSGQTATVQVKPPTPRELADTAMSTIWWQFAQMPWSINEAHDGQRLAYGAKYGPFVMVYSSPYLGGFTNDGHFSDQGTDGMLVAIVYVERTTPPGPLPAPYTELHLAPGLNCVHAVFQAPNWKGYITPATPTGPSGLPECARPYAQNAGTQLRVRPQPTAYASAADYPPVTRISEWDIDHYVIGFRCAAHWCEMGSSAFASVPPADEPGPASRERDIKGWHDEQRLGVMSGGTLVPSDLIGKATPVANLADYQETDFDTERRVGSIFFRNPVLADKHKKYYGVGFRQGANQVFSRRLSATAWQTRIVFSDGSQRIFQVKRMAHYDISVPGTMRWYWNDKDEGLWYRCGGACCEVEF